MVSLTRFFFLLALFSVVSLSAQVTVGFTLRRNLYLAYEPLLVTVTIHNGSGGTLLLASEEEQPWLSFQIETERGTPLSCNPAIKEIAPILLASGETVSREVELTDFYPLGDVGSYHLSAVVYVSSLKHHFHSPSSVLQITEGHLLSEQHIGLPSSMEGVFEKRVITLLSHRYSDYTLLYLRIEDENRGSILCTAPLGRIVTPSKPELFFDKNNQIHILQHEAPGIFLYSHLNDQGRVIERQPWSALPQRPHLVMSKEGRVHLVGGKLVASPPNS